MSKRESDETINAIEKRNQKHTIEAQDLEKPTTMELTDTETTDLCMSTISGESGDSP